MSTEPRTSGSTSGNCNELSVHTISKALIKDRQLARCVKRERTPTLRLCCCESKTVKWFWKFGSSSDLQLPYEPTIPLTLCPQKLNTLFTRSMYTCPWHNYSWQSQIRTTQAHTLRGQRHTVQWHKRKWNEDSLQHTWTLKHCWKQPDMAGHGGYIFSPSTQEGEAVWSIVNSRAARTTERLPQK